MLENETLVTNVTENVEQATEAPAEKTYTQSQLDEIVGKRLARNSAKIRKEYDRKYGNLEEVLRAGTGEESIEAITDTFTKFYEKKGIEIKREPNYSDEDIEVLARADANNIIQYGYEDVVEEVDRLAEIGIDNMNPRERAYFKALAEHRQNTERSNELQKIGVTDEVYNSKEFQDFAGQFKPNTPIADIWNIYNKTQPKKDIKPMGSIKGTPTDDAGVKDYYSFEEAKQFTKEDFDRNPALYRAVTKSMTKW